MNIKLFVSVTSVIALNKPFSVLFSIFNYIVILSKDIKYRVEYYPYSIHMDEGIKYTLISDNAAE